MIAKRLTSTLTLVLIGILAAIAQDATFELMQPRNVVEGNNFNITFRLSNGDGNAPAAPQLENCTLLYGPSSSTMQSTSIVNGHMTSSYSIDYSFVYRADKAGKVEVPAVTVTSGGKTLSSRPASFTILPPDSNQPARRGSQHGNAQVSPSAPSRGQVSADDLLVRVSFSKSAVYEQEPVVATIKVYTKYDISSFMVTTQPAFEGFLTEELPVSMESSIEHYNGQNYHTAVLKRLLLYPQRSGRLSVNSGKYDVTIVQYESVNMGFFRTSRPVERQVTTSSNAASIQVNALPEPRPAAFSGAVGTFSVETKIEPEILRTNEAAVYSYIVKGRGNIKYLNQPAVQFPAGIDTYTPKTEIDASVVGGANMSGTYRTDFTFVPQEVGNFELEGVPFVYFNPDSREYVTVDVPSKELKVLRGNNAVAAPSQTTIDNVIDDILHIKPIAAESQTHELNYTFRSGTYWLAYALTALILIGVIIVYRRHIRLQSDVAGRRLAKASRVAVRRLKLARQHMERHENEQFYAALAKALWGYISDKLSIAPSQLTRDNVASKLEIYGLDADQTAEVLEVLDRCEMARFTPTHTDDEVAQNYSLAQKAINSIENVKKR